jgi:hypothetical protein
MEAEHRAKPATVNNPPQHCRSVGHRNGDRSFYASRGFDRLIVVRVIRRLPDLFH